MRSDELDARSDIYSLGVVVYEMLTGRTPFHSDTPVGYLRKHLMEEPPPFRAVEPGLLVPPRIESVVMKALTKDRNQRYGSVLEFAQEFAQAAEAGSHLSAQPQPQREGTKAQPLATATPVPKTSVPVAVRGTVAARAVTETARPPRRKWLVRWKRVGIIASIVWILGVGTYTLMLFADVHDGFILAAIFTLLVVPLGWGFIYLVLFLVRWVNRPPGEASTQANVDIDIQAPPPFLPQSIAEAQVAQSRRSKPVGVASRPLAVSEPPRFRRTSKRPGKMKFVAIGTVALILLVAGVWYFRRSAYPPIVKPQVESGVTQTGTGQHSPAVEPSAPTESCPGMELSKPGETFYIELGPGTDVVWARRCNQVYAAKGQGDKDYDNGKYDEAISAYQGGLKLDPSNAPLLQALRRARTAKAAEEKFNQ